MGTASESGSSSLALTVKRKKAAINESRSEVQSDVSVSAVSKVKAKPVAVMKTASISSVKSSSVFIGAQSSRQSSVKHSSKSGGRS